MKNVEKPIKFLPCDDGLQVYSWQRTNKKATYKNYSVEYKLKQYRNDKRKH